MKRKVCISCKKEKRIALFYRKTNTLLKGPEGRLSSCKDCIVKRQEWNKKSDNAQLAKMLNKDSGLKRKYGITLEQKRSMAIAQNFSCLICKRRESLFPNGLVVDHCHTSGKIRGLLCSPCNTRLGVVENKDFVMNAKTYLGT